MEVGLDGGDVEGVGEVGGDGGVEQWMRWIQASFTPGMWQHEPASIKAWHFRQSKSIAATEVKIYMMKEGTMRALCVFIAVALSP